MGNHASQLRPNTGHDDRVRSMIVREERSRSRDQPMSAVNHIVRGEPDLMIHLIQEMDDPITHSGSA